MLLITHRFSKDIDGIDYTLPHSLRRMVIIALTVVLAILGVVYNLPAMLTVILPLIMLYAAMQVLVVQSYS